MHPTMRPEPPVPRSQQLRNAAAAAAAGGAPTPVPPPRSNQLTPTGVASVPQPVSNRRNNSSSIDYAKYKTKLCRNFLMGLPCPFESRCVFAHGEDQLSAHDPNMPQSSTSQFGGSMEFPHTHSGVAEGYMHNVSGSDDEGAAAATSCPPTYESFLATHAMMEGASPMGSEPASPVSPMRYRHDPYHPDGYVLKFY
jgi:hypothetical protein